MNKITAKDKYNALISALTTGETSVDPAELVEFCKAKIEELDKKAAKAKERAAAKRAEGDELRELVYSVIGADDFMTRAAVYEALDGKVDDDVTVAKVGARINQLVNDGRVEKTEISIERDGKKAKAMAYRRLG